MTRAYLRLPWRNFFAFTASWTGSRVEDVLCAAFVGLSVAVPGAYGMNNAFHGYVPRVFGLLNTPDTENAATISAGSRTLRRARRTATTGRSASSRTRTEPRRRS